MKKNLISISNKVLFGKPHIKGTRITVEQVLRCLSQGWSNTKITKEFGISEEEIKECINYASHSISRTHFVNTSDKVYV